MPKKNERPPVALEIKWTEDETNPGALEPSKKIALELARALGRMAARKELKAWEDKQWDLEARCRALSDACDELLNSVIVKAPDMPRSDKT